MCRKLVLLVLSAWTLFAAAAFRQTAAPTLAGVVQDEPSAVVHDVTAAARIFSPGGDVIANNAPELSPRTSHTRKNTAEGGGLIRALCEFKALSTDAPGFCTTSGLVGFRPFDGGEFGSAVFELRRSDAMDARNFFAASANCLERNRSRGALGGTLKQNESTYGNDARQLPGTAFTKKISISAMAGGPRMGGLHGWQWLYPLESTPAVRAGAVVMSLPADNPDQVRLTAREKRLLRARMAEEQTSVSEGRHLSMLLDASRSSGQIGLLGAIPWTLGSIAMLTIARHSDVTSERRWQIAVAGVAGSALAASAIHFSPFPIGRRSISGMT